MANRTGERQVSGIRWRKTETWLFMQAGQTIMGEKAGGNSVSVCTIGTGCFKAKADMKFSIL